MKGDIEMATMIEVKQWGEEATELVKCRNEAKQKRQKIKFGKKTIFTKKDEPINMADLVK